MASAIEISAPEQDVPQARPPAGQIFTSLGPNGYGTAHHRHPAMRPASASPTGLRDRRAKAAK